MFSTYKVGSRCNVISLQKLEWSLFYLILFLFFLFHFFPFLPVRDYCSLFIKAADSDSELVLCLLVLV